MTTYKKINYPMNVLDCIHGVEWQRTHRVPFGASAPIGFGNGPIAFSDDNIWRKWLFLSTCIKAELIFPNKLDVAEWGNYLFCWLANHIFMGSYDLFQIVSTNVVPELENKHFSWKDV